MRTHRSTFFAVLFVALAVGTLLTWAPSPAVAGDSPSPHVAGLTLPGYRSVVIGATVVSLAALDLPGPTSVPTVPAPAPVPSPPVTAPPPPAAGPPVFPLGGVWAQLRQCESGGNYAVDTGNGYYGAYQFSATTWHGLGFTGLPSESPPAVQDEAAVELQARSGWGQWPACSRRLGLL